MPHGTPYLAIAIIHSIFVASIVTTVFATIFYTKDLYILDRIAYRLPGQRLIFTAMVLTAITILFVGIFICVLLAFPPIEKAPKGCSFSELSSEFGTHVAYVSVLFLIFLVIDIFTVVGTKKAAGKLDEAAPPHSPDDLDRLHDLRTSAEFARDQIWLVDVPVLLGAIASYYLVPVANMNVRIMHFATGMLNFNSNPVCNDHELTVETFDVMVSNLFVGGIAAGFLAAHIVMSQLVFIALGALYRRKRRRPVAAGISK
jgi:hypothetical protein